MESQGLPMLFLVNNQFACMLCGLGFDAKVAHEFADSAQARPGYLRFTHHP